jgi:Ca2+-binding EF-hand superfamily protein
VLPALAGDEPAVGQASADEVRQLIFLADARPVLVRLHLFVNGEPFVIAHQKARERYYRSLFAYLDHHGKGWLDEPAARRLPSPPTWRRYGQREFGSVNVAFNFQVLDSDSDGRVSLKELADYYRVFGVDHLQIESVPRPLTIRSSALSDALFNRADRDKDGKLSQAELAALASSVLPLDQDEDEMIAPEEIVANAPAAQQSATRRFTPSFLLTAPGEDASGLTQTLLARYGPKSERWRNEAELGRFTERPADLEMTIRLGERQAGQDFVEILHFDKPASGDWRVTPVEDGGVIFDIADLRVELRGLRDPIDAIIEENRQALRQRFHALDARSRGWLEKRDAVLDRLFALIFDLMDRDGDGKLQKEELEHYLSAVQDLQLRAEISQVQFLVSEEGRGLFDLLDRNRDGRLSRRELLSAASTLAPYIREPGGLKRDDIPRSYQLVVGLARYEPWVFDSEPPGLPMSGWRTAPRWFRKMDRNQDGDVSLREFLGSREQFQRLDKNGDGLISIEEAEKAANRERKK